MYVSILSQRGVLEIKGEDKATFLQGLITNDINLVTPHHAIYTTLLSPQGRFLFDFFIIESEDSYLLDAEASRLGDLLKKLRLYKLRSKVTLNLRPDLQVYAFWGEDVAAQLDLKEEPGNLRECFFIDPRLLALGARFIGTDFSWKFQIVTPKDYDVHRLKLGIPEGGIDLIPEKSIPLECGLDELNAISWTKGCYMGQELTARTKYRGLVRKRLFPVNIEGDPPQEGTEILQNENSVGELRSHKEHQGMAHLRIEALKAQGELLCGQARLKPYVPVWMRLEDPS
ncbi:MAG: folate-binding protein [Alphaproteobacteria bacterium]|nr:folate-binding protein [Alphaproteobacteria bacterium]